MDVGALLFLLRGVGWLEDEDSLACEEEASGVEELELAERGEGDC